MVPGVRRDPAVLYRSQYILKSLNPSFLQSLISSLLKSLKSSIYRDQTHTLVSAVAPTSIKFLELVVGASASPAFQPTFNAFPTNVAAAEGDGGGYAVLGWADGDLSTVDR